MLLATWRHLLDSGSLQDDEPHLAATARPAVAWMSAATASQVGVHFGQKVTVSNERGAITLPAAEAELPDGVVWLPTNSPGSAIRSALAAGHGAIVTVVPAGGLEYAGWPA